MARRKPAQRRGGQKNSFFELLEQRQLFAAGDEVIVDNLAATFTGPWSKSSYDAGFYDTNYAHDGATGKGTRSALFTATLPEAASYEVFARYTSSSNRAINVPYDVNSLSGVTTTLVNQATGGGTWVSLGVYDFDTTGSVNIRTTGTTGYVIADAIRFVEQGPVVPVAPAAPTGLLADAQTDTRLRLTWVDHSNNETGFEIERKAEDESDFTPLTTTAANATSFDDTTVAALTSYTYRVRAINAVGPSDYSNESTDVTPDVAPPTLWTGANIGNPSMAGSVAENAGSVTVKGGGSDIQGTNDQFFFAYQTLTGDGTITARVASVQNTNKFAKAGVMIRETTAVGSKHAFVAVEPTAVEFERRTATGGSTTYTQTTGVTAPYWVRLTRSGTTITAYRSANGTSWTSIGSVNISMVSTVNVGLAVTAHDNSKLNTSVFDNVSITTPEPPTIPDAPDNLVTVALTASSVKLTWADRSDNETGFQVERKTGDGEYVLIATPGANATTYTDTTAEASTTYTYRVRATNVAGPSAYTNESTVVTPEPPPPATFNGANIGNPGMAGSVAENAGTFTVRGSGADIQGTSDQFYFAYQSVTGDMTITARVASIQNTNTYAKAGVMIRQGTAANAKHAFVAVEPAAVEFEHRATAGGSTNYTQQKSLTAPYWVRLVKQGSTFSAYRSVDGASWTLIGTTAIDMTGTLLIGLAVTAHNNSKITTGVFDNVSIVPSEPVTPPTPLPADFTPLFNGENFDGFYTYIDGLGVDNDPGNYFKVENGMIHVLDLDDTSGEKPFGYLSTETPYGNYHLRMEYKWGTTKYSPRLNTVRDAGVIFGITGQDRIWPSMVELQIQEHDTGDAWLLTGTGATTTVNNPSADQPTYQEGGSSYTAVSGPGLAERIIKSAEPESLTDWNTIDLIVSGDDAVFMVNGVVVNRLYNLTANGSPLTSGRIAFQAEGAEVYYRNIEIRGVGSTPPPAGATVLLGSGNSTSAWRKRNSDTTINWPVSNGVMTVNTTGGDIRTVDTYTDFTLHVEFKNNLTPGVTDEQGKGNSGIYLQQRYEVQILDSFGHPLEDANDNGAIYGLQNASVNASYPADTWQSYDITFTAARWSDGVKIANARVTVVLNGVLIQDDIELTDSTYLGDPESPDAGPITLQDHDNTVQFRNIWIKPN